MELVREWADYESSTGGVAAFLARPACASGPVPAVVVIQEIWGVDQHIQDIVERFANSGYLALAPDLYSAGSGRPPALEASRIDGAKAFMNSIPPAEWMTVLSDETLRNKELAKLPDGEGAKVAETIGTLFGRARGSSSHDLETLVSAVGFLGSHPACEGRSIGVVGFCMGGGLSAQLACSDANIDAAAIFYGASPGADQVSQIRCPIRGFYGQNDPNIVSGLPGFAKELEKAGIDYDLRIYPDTPHAFFNDTRPSYRQEAARDAWGSLLAFFAVALGSVPTLSAADWATENSKG
ncbi:MAG: dienelactone hydrolase family protein [Actinomycetota bacterium]|nr:MAG: dienelactone hydrolase family protein [Actinomycetota bacterium]